MVNAARTLTFLFTDIEGSTALWEGRPEEMSVALRRHDTILRAGIETAGGMVFKTGGDAFYSVFDFPRGAVAAAVAIQEALANESWSGPELHVRAAIHTGEVEERDSDYFGPTMNSVARLLSAGHGDQILLSESSYGLVRDKLAPGVDVLPLGAHRLKDLRRPMEIFQLRAAGLRLKFPSLRALTSRSNNLPAQLTSFIGRDREITEAKALLRASRLVTLTGSGGTGKTRLALQVAADALDDFGDGLWFVDLASLSEPEGVPSAVATTLGLRDDPTQPLLAALTEFLRGRQILLVLDNCEHVIAGCAALAAALLGSCPRLHILATSREALAIPGESAMGTPSLSLPPAGGVSETTADSIVDYEAVRLFTDRALAAAPHFTVTNVNAHAVAQICSRLDGVPLAIELAAARVRSLSVEQIAERLDDRFRLLTGGSRTALPRQQTLRAAIDWSHELLTEPEQTVLRRLSVFSGGWTLEAAEAVCASAALDSGEILDLVARLVDRSLVTFDDEPAPRYRFLETVRQYSQEKLIEAGEADATRAAHLAWFVDWAEKAATSATTPDAIADRQRVRNEDANLLAALQSARGQPDPPHNLMRLVAALGYPLAWEGGGRQYQVAQAFDALSRSEGQRTALRAQVLAAAGWLLLGISPERAQSQFRESIQLARELDESRTVVLGLFGLGHATFSAVTTEGALSAYEEVLELARTPELNDSERAYWESSALNGIGSVAMSRGDRESAVAHWACPELTDIQDEGEYPGKGCSGWKRHEDGRGERSRRSSRGRWLSSAGQAARASVRSAATSSSRRRRCAAGWPRQRSRAVSVRA